MDSNALGHHLKIWADSAPCVGETKGGYINLQHEKFVVTSNYSIDELFADSPKLIEPIKRRFKIFHYPVSWRERLRLKELGLWVNLSIRFIIIKMVFKKRTFRRKRRTFGRRKRRGSSKFAKRQQRAAMTWIRKKYTKVFTMDVEKGALE